MGIHLLSLDFATKTGFAFCKGATISSGFVDFKAKSKQPNEQRLINFKQWLDDNATGVTVISYEAVRNMKNANVVVALAEMQSVLKVFAISRNIKLMPYSAKEIKKFATGNGNAGKPDMIKACNEKYNLSITDDNEADAICLLGLTLHDLYVGN